MAPKYFRVVVERRSDPEVHTFILPSVKRASGTTIDLRFQETGMVGEIRLFVKTLVGALPKFPWAGLRLMESCKEKRKWLELIEHE